MPLTPEYIAAMLGIAWSNITIFLPVLEQQGLISTSRKQIRIRDRPELLVLVESFYGKPKQEYVDIMNARAHRFRELPISHH